MSVSIFTISYDRLRLCLKYRRHLLAGMDKIGEHNLIWTCTVYGKYKNSSNSSSPFFIEISKTRSQQWLKLDKE